MGSRSDFSKGSISKNILSLALPMTAAQLVNVLYSVVDRKSHIKTLLFK